MRLRWYVLAIVSLILVPLALVAALVVWLSHRDERKEMEQALLARARVLAVAVDREVETCIAALEGLATSDHLDAGDLRKFYEQARRARTAHDQWLSVALIDPSGQHLMNLLQPLGTPLPSMATVEVFQQTVRTLEPAVSDLFLGPTAGRWLIAVDVPVLRDGKLRYVLSASMRPDGFASILAGAQISSDSLATIIDRKGIVVARTRDQAERVGKPAAPSYVAFASGHEEGVFLGRTSDGWNAYSAFSRAPRSRLAVRIAIPVEQVDAPLSRSLWRVAGAVAAAFGASLTLAILVGRRVARRMAGLARVLSAFARGETTPDLPKFWVAEFSGVTQALTDAMALLQARTEALRESERRYRETFERSPAGMCLTVDDGRILDCNQAFARTLGFGSPAEALTANAGDVYADPTARAQLLERTRREGAVVNAELQLRRRDGRLIWALANVVRVSGQSPGDYEATVIDITERRQVEELRSITRLANAAAHEINNPLTIIVGRLAMLAEDPSLDADARARITQAQTAAERIKQIVAEMQRLTRVELFEHSSPRLPEMVDFRKSAAGTGRPEVG